MKKRKRERYLHIINVITVALVVECFLCSILVVRKYAREDCFDRIEETTVQMSYVLNHALDDSREKLEVFADILGTNSQNPDAMLSLYMQNFCQTQDFAATCIHRANGTAVSWGEHFHDTVSLLSYAEETTRLPYFSPIYSMGETADKKFFYIAVPIERDGAAVGILYGYMKLDILPEFVTSIAYGGKCQLFLVDGDTGNFLMDTRHDGTLGNLAEMGDQKTKPGYDMDIMRAEVREGKSGYYIFQSRTTGDWLYTYYMPTGINNWSMQMTIDEKTAFAGYNDISSAIIWVGIIVIVMMMIHVAVLMLQTAMRRSRDKARLEKSRYMSEVQRALLNAHNNPDFVEQALKTVAQELRAETVLLLTLSDRTVRNSYYWPSTDRAQALNMVGRNIREDFPVLFDALYDAHGVIYDVNDAKLALSDSAKTVFSQLDVKNLMLAPIMDNAGNLKGTICAANLAELPADCDLLTCVTYDFFMAITNIENHSLIKQMGEMDYLTRIKNRNSYEAELPALAAISAGRLWCVFIDVNGLHELNNTQGHKAGDRMLCTVADQVRHLFNPSMTYRVGGDEFVAFALDGTAELMEAKKSAITADLASRGYYVSIGYAEAVRGKSGLFDMERLVSDAEAIMYREKRAYYEKNHLLTERGHFPEPR